MMTEAEAALREAMRRIDELERRLKQLEAKVGSSWLMALQIKPGSPS
jgi:hypothetical protein